MIQMCNRSLPLCEIKFSVVRTIFTYFHMVAWLALHLNFRRLVSKLGVILMVDLVSSIYCIALKSQSFYCLPFQSGCCWVSNMGALCNKPGGGGGIRDKDLIKRLFYSFTSWRQNQGGYLATKWRRWFGTLCHRKLWQSWINWGRNVSGKSEV